jgi:hypothetical protein
MPGLPSFGALSQRVNGSGCGPLNCWPWSHTDNRKAMRQALSENMADSERQAADEPRITCNISVTTNLYAPEKGLA